MNDSVYKQRWKVKLSFYLVFWILNIEIYLYYENIFLENQSFSTHLYWLTQIYISIKALQGSGKYAIKLNLLQKCLFTKETHYIKIKKL